MHVIIPAPVEISRANFQNASTLAHYVLDAGQYEVELVDIAHRPVAADATPYYWKVRIPATTTYYAYKYVGDPASVGARTVEGFNDYAYTAHKGISFRTPRDGVVTYPFHNIPESCNR
jgi:hypothetical protein